jgi:hypothetical protein
MPADRGRETGRGPGAELEVEGGLGDLELENGVAE